MIRCKERRSITAGMLRKNRALAEAFVESLTPSELDALLYDWSFWARDEQLPPDEWVSGEKYVWTLRCGRGWGKTRTAGAAIIEAVSSGEYKHLSLCGATAEEVRDIMINGESGILKHCPPWLGLEYKPSRKKIYFNNGAVISIFYGSEPEKSRGAQSDFLWADEIHKWQHPKQTFDNLLLGLRLGKNPLCVVTSTPKPTAFAKELEALTDEEGRSCVVTTIGNTYANKDNLSPKFFSMVISKYEGTRLGLQELHAEILDDNPNALFKQDWIENNKVDTLPPYDGRYRVGVGVDPAASHKKTSNHTGIIVVLEGRAPDELVTKGAVKHKKESHFYVLDDLSIIGTPLLWGMRAVEGGVLYDADMMIVEDNQGGDMVESTLLNAGCEIPILRIHATTSKYARALNSSTLCEQGRIHFFEAAKEPVESHDISRLDLLKDELCTWEPGDDSPDRMDAMVHVINFFKPDLKDVEKEARAKGVLASVFSR